MTESALRYRAWRHNALQIVAGLAAALWAAVMWPVSFWIMKALAGKPFQMAGIENDHKLPLLAAAVGLGLLAIESVRYWRLIVAEKEDNGQSDFDSMPILPAGAAMMEGRFFNIRGAYLLVHVMLSAPRMTALAVHATTRLVRAPSAACTQAATVYNRLAADRRWTSLSECSDCGAGVFLLDRLRLIWTRIEDGETQIRIPPGSGHKRR